MMRPRRYGILLADYAGLALVLALMVAFFAWRTEYFFTRTTFLTIANQIPDPLVIAVGMTFVLIVAGIDLSVGSVLALSAAVLGVLLTRTGLPLPFALAACVAVGLACGMLNGVLVLTWSLPSFIVTLGMLEAARGGAYFVTQSQSQYIGERIGQLASAQVHGLSLPFILAMGVVATGQVVLSGTVFGRHMLAIGANEEAARLSGVPVRAVKMAVYSASGALAGLAAVINTARMETVDPNVGSGYELQAIAAVVIGGTSLMGGRGSVVNTFFGVVIIAVLENGLVQVAAPDPLKRIITGGVIVVAVVIDYYRNRLRGRSA
jgi:ribose transport system permease protein